MIGLPRPRLRLRGRLKHVAQRVARRAHGRVSILVATARDQEIALGRGVELDPGCRIERRWGGSIRLADGVRVYRGAIVSSYSGFVDIGARVFVGPYCVLYGPGGLSIGEDTMIAAHTVIASNNHVFADATRTIREQGVTAEGVRIGRDVWIGANATILDGVDVGDGAVVAAGAVVTRSVPPLTVVAGVPAKPIGRRNTPTDAPASPSARRHGRFRALETSRDDGVEARTAPA